MSAIKHEYLNGEIFAMAGATVEHAALTAAIPGLLGGQLRGGPCRLYSSDLRVCIRASGLYTYPDGAVICGEPERVPESPTHVTNPRVIFEVLSPATEDYDRGERREHYQKLASLQVYVLVAQDRRLVEVFTRTGEAWVHRVYRPGDVVDLPSIAARFDVGELYDTAGVSAPT